MQISQVRTISTELDQSRLECVESTLRVQGNLGIEVDPNENFTQPLHEKMADALMMKVDRTIIKDGLDSGVMSADRL